MKDYTLMLVGDERSPVRRFHVPAGVLKKALIGGVIAVLVGVVGFWDYWRLRADNAELTSLRIEAAEQREQLQLFGQTIEQVESELIRVKELERKVRIIANLPGATATGGDAVTELAPPMPVGGDPAAPGLALPAGVPVEAPELGQGGDEPHAHAMDDLDDALASGLATEKARRVRQMEQHAKVLDGAAEFRGVSLEELVEQLEKKRTKLASSPSIWPAKGWLTSRYGYRVSPFTGKRQLHGGIDIAARRGTPVVAPAKGRVKFVGRKGPLGNAIVLDHGFGVSTLYGHNEELLVKAGEEVERGQQIAAVGSSGRSTGPHLHYVVQIGGKSTDPLNYIFD